MKLRVTAALAICVVRLLGFLRIFKVITSGRATSPPPNGAIEVCRDYE